MGGGGGGGGEAGYEGELGLDIVDTPLRRLWLKHTEREKQDECYKNVLAVIYVMRHDLTYI